jgi:hypothetical protein
VKLLGLGRQPFIVGVKGIGMCIIIEGAAAREMYIHKGTGMNVDRTIGLRYSYIKTSSQSLPHCV